MYNLIKVAPEGSTVLCPYLMIESVEAQMEFLVKVFDAKITEDAKRSDGFIEHGEVLIGDTTVMMGRASRDFPARQSMNYVYVDNTDEIHHKALNFGAIEIIPPTDRVYGVRESGFIDPFGNQWWAGQIIKKQESKTAITDLERLKQTELEWNQCIEDNKVVEMAKYMSDDWVIFSGDGNITTKQMFLKSVESGDLVHLQMDFEILQVKVYGSTGIVMQKGTSSGTWQGQSFNNYEIATSLFIKADYGWIAVQTMIAPANYKS